MRIFICLFFGFFVIITNAQIPHSIEQNDTLTEIITEHSPIHETVCQGLIGVDKNTPQWNYEFKNLTRKHKAEDDKLLRQIKEEKTKLKFKNYQPDNAETMHKSQMVGPSIISSFQGTEMYHGTPPDNTLAVSNDGYIVVADNSTIEYYDVNGANILNDKKHYDFLGDNTLTGNIFDPKLIYDSEADRFIFVILHTNQTFSKSDILLCFSKSNNPDHGWYFYKLPGDVLNDNSWFDYPSIGVSNNELFISGNLFTSTGYLNKPIIIQIDKNKGYTGANITWISWSFSGSVTICPVSYGHQGNYGPEMYFVRTKSIGGNTIEFFTITDEIGNSPSVIKKTITISAYSVPGQSAQKGSNDLLDNGDCRIQSGFYLNGIIHFVFASDIGNGWTGINYNRLDISDLSIRSSMFGLKGTYDYAYPSVASFTTSPSGTEVAIAFLRSGTTIYPEVRVINVNKGMVFSSSVLVKEGESKVELSTGEERWGDFTYICRKHNSPTPIVWMTGCYGDDNTKTNNGYSGWIAEVGGTTVVSTDEKTQTRSKSKIYPNPVLDLFHFEFELEAPEEIEIFIIDINGRKVKTFYNDMANPGINRLTFNKNALSQGTYFIKVQSSNKVFTNEKFTVIH